MNRCRIIVVALLVLTLPLHGFAGRRCCRQESGVCCSTVAATTTGCCSEKSAAVKGTMCPHCKGGLVHENPVQQPMDGCRCYSVPAEHLPGLGTFRFSLPKAAVQWTRLVPPVTYTAVCFTLDVQAGFSKSQLHAFKSVWLI